MNLPNSSNKGCPGPAASTQSVFFFCFDKMGHLEQVMWNHHGISDIVINENACWDDSFQSSMAD